VLKNLTNKQSIKGL